MKKSSLQSLVNYFAFQNGLPSDVADAVDELKAELNRGAEKAQKNRELYEEARGAVYEGLRVAGVPVTIAELYAEVEGKLPENFGKSKLQYAVTRLWAEDIVKHEGKVNAYSLREGA